jgi:diguanylate cyclase (GGDEF)-like protein/PAS domain S-box-containing protein
VRRTGDASGALRRRGRAARSLVGRIAALLLACVAPGSALADQPDIWQRHAPVAGASAGAMLLAGVVVRLARTNRRLRAGHEEAEVEAGRMRALLDGSRAGTWEWNVQTGETRFNERWAEIVGHRLEALQPVSIDTWRRLAHPEDLARSNEALQRHFRGECDHYDVEVRMRHRDGRWVWVRDRGRVASWTADGRPLWMAGTHVDITPRKDAEAARDEMMARLNQLACHVPGALYQYRLRSDGSSHFPFATAGIRDVYGCDPADVREDAGPVFAVLHPGDAPRVREGIDRSARDLSVWRDAYRVCHPEKGIRVVAGDATPTRHEDGSVTWHGYLRDVTETQAATERLELAAKALELDHSGVVITDAKWRVLDANPAFTRLTGYERSEVLGRDARELHFGTRRPAFLRDLVKALSANDQWQGEVTSRRRHGGALVGLLSIGAVRGHRGAVTHHVAAFRDITELRARQSELQHFAYHDQLTGLPNRRSLDERLAQLLAQAERTGGEVTVCVLDLDGFKAVNDRHGHAAGDRLLAEIAARLTRVVRAGETIARLGGDEFALLLSGPPADAFFDRIRAAVGASVTLAEGTVRVSASLGVARSRPGQRVDGDRLLRQADQALYRAKALGKDRTSLFEELSGT